MPIRSEFNFHLPPGLHLVLADVDSGSNTPKMVTAVLEWKRCAQQEGEALWENLDFLNQSIVNGFKELNSLAISSPSLYLQALELFDYSVSTFSNQITKCLAELRMNFIKIRELFRGLSKRTGVPIEPPGQTRLLDACMKVPGVLFAGVPGGKSLLKALNL
jgi:phosphomevalonate kinase